jgi:hypothetical protein
MAIYRVPITMHRPSAKTKARIDFDLQAASGVVGGHIVLPVPGAKIVEFEAPSHAEAARRLQLLVAGDDPRPIMCRAKIRWFSYSNAADRFDPEDGDREAIQPGDHIYYRGPGGGPG